jgi:hypothetical protein
LKIAMHARDTSPTRNNMIRVLPKIANVALGGRDFTDAEGVKQVRPGQRPGFADGQNAR